MFSIEEETLGGGSSYCWVERRRDDFILFGNELGAMSGLCPNALTALASSGAEFGSRHTDIKSTLAPSEFRSACGLINFQNVGRLTVNGFDLEARDVDGILEHYQRQRE